MTTCFTCQTELSEQALYCRICGTQVRCKNPECRDVLELGSRFCGTCGTSLHESAASAVVLTNGHGKSDQALNKLDFEETTKSRSLHAALTNEAVESLSTSLGVYVGNRISVVAPMRRGIAQPPTVVENAQLSLPGYATETTDQVDHVDAVDESAAEVIHPPPAGTERDNLRRFFSYDGERLRLIDSRLKAKSKANFAQNLTLLFLYAHELEGREKVPRSSLTTILEEATVNDGNHRTWISKTAELMPDGDRVGLTVPGRERARKVLADALNPAVKDRWILGTSSTSRGRAGKSGAANGEKKGKTSKSAGGRKSSVAGTVAEWKSKWQNLGLNVDGYKTIKDKSLLDKGIFGLWAIRRAAGEAGKVVSRAKLKSFLYEAFEIPVDERHLAAALQSKAAKGMVIKVEGGYQLQPDGMAHAEQMAGVTKVVANASSKGAAKK